MRKFLAVYGKPRYLGLVAYDGDIKKGEKLVVESMRGEELAMTVGELSPQQESEYRQMKHSSEHGDGVIKNSEPVVSDLQFLDFASEEDCDAELSYREEEKSILGTAKRLLIPHNLDMKLIDVEFLRAKRKLFFYFSSEQRVDFRAYVRDLAREFKTRIELRQVGVRDEAKIIRGVGSCGRPCCCSYWLNQFSPVGIKMVKEQNLALNPSKISGICGRLMCCMSFEHNVYHEAWDGLPHQGAKIKTPNGSIVVTGIDLPTGSLRCFVAGKGEIKIPKDKFDEFKETVAAGGEWALPEDEPPLPVKEAFSVELHSELVKLERPSERICESVTVTGTEIKITEERAESSKGAKRRQKHPIRNERHRESNNSESFDVEMRFASDSLRSEGLKKSGDRTGRQTPRHRRTGTKKSRD